MNGVCWYYDAAALVLLVLFIIQGVKKGFSKTVIHFALNLVFVVLAFLMSGIMTDMVYDGYFRSTVSEAVESSLENFDVNSELKKVYSELTLIGEVSDTKISAVLSSEKNMDEKFQKLIVSTSGIGSQIDESKIFEGLNSIVKFRLHEKLSEKIPSCAGKYFSSLDESNKEEINEVHLIILYCAGSGFNIRNGFFNGDSVGLVNCNNAKIEQGIRKRQCIIPNTI